MTALDQISLALCAWKEDRGGGVQGMHAVINVIVNRAKKRGTSVYAEIYRPMQFSSMSAPHDPELLIQPPENDPQWQAAKALATSASTGVLEDLTGGATFYYAISMDPPAWAKGMTLTVVIGRQRYFREA